MGLEGRLGGLTDTYQTGQARHARPYRAALPQRLGLGSTSDPGPL
jgi:hypothetical protein